MIWFIVLNFYTKLYILYILCTSFAHSSHCCEDGAEPVLAGVSFSRHCPGLITQKELPVAPGNDVILSADAGTRCLEECTWISPVSEYQRQLQCDFNLKVFFALVQFRIGSSLSGQDY